MKSHLPAFVLAGLLLGVAAPAWPANPPRVFGTIITQEWFQDGGSDDTTRLFSAPFAYPSYIADGKGVLAYPVNWATDNIMRLPGEPSVNYFYKANQPGNGPFGLVLTVRPHPTNMFLHYYDLRRTTDGNIAASILLGVCGNPSSQPVLIVEEDGVTAHILAIYNGCRLVTGLTFTLNYHLETFFDRSVIPPVTSYIPTYDVGNYDWKTIQTENKSTLSFTPKVSGNQAYVTCDLREDKKAGILRAFQWRNMAESWKAALQAGNSSGKPIPRGQEPPPSEEVYQATTAPSIRGTTVVVCAVKMKGGDKKNEETDPVEGALFAFDTVNGAMKWTYKYKGKALSSPAMTSDAVIFGTNRGQVHAVGIDGSLRWATPEGGKIMYAPRPFNIPSTFSEVTFYGPAVDAYERYAYFGGSDGRIYRFEVRGGANTASLPICYYVGYSSDSGKEYVAGAQVLRPATIQSPPILVAPSTENREFLATKIYLRNPGTDRNVAALILVAIPELEFRFGFAPFTPLNRAWATPGELPGIGDGTPTGTFGGLNLAGAGWFDNDFLHNQVAFVVPDTGISGDDVGGISVAEGIIFALSKSEDGQWLDVIPSARFTTPPPGFSASSGAPPTFIPPPQLGPIQVYPNPFKPDEAVRGTAKFRNLPAGSRVELFTLANERVRVLNESSNRAEWDGRNESGQKVASGIYSYIVYIPRQPEVRGRLALVRK